MIEPIMYFAIGFLAAILLSLMIMPLVHNRAVRLTTLRLEAATPLSMAEIQADKDQLRAEFAMSARRLELNVDQLKAKATTQLAEIGKKSDAINRLKLELGEKTATIFALETREKNLREQLKSAEEEFSAKVNLLQNAEQALRDKQTELTKLSSDLSDRSMTADRRKSELVAVNAQVENLKTRLAAAETEHAEAEKRLAEHRENSEAVARELADAKTVAAAAENPPHAESSSVQSENALLRERINGIAAEVAKLAAALEGPDSPIEAILAAEPKPGINAIINGASADHGGQPTLVQRIRELQARAAQATEIHPA